VPVPHGNLSFTVNAAVRDGPANASAAVDASNDLRVMAEPDGRSDEFRAGAEAA
jgi:hypothetical protein